MKKTLLIVVSFVLATHVFAGSPDKRTCGSMEALERLKAQDPALESRMTLIEQQTAAYINEQRKNGGAAVQSVITIPVVFHIVYSTNAKNISDAQCIAQLEQLNLDFARLNSDASNTPSAFSSAAANTGIQFCLAKRTPSGAATTGIERRKTNKASFNTNDQVKQYSKGGLDAWNSSKYLNIWVCNLGQNLLGYAQFPGGPAATDGVVLLYSSVGSMTKPGTVSKYNLGRTATHEVGHWLNLRHIWGDDGGSCSGSDQVGDTPNQAGQLYGCPAFPKTDACSPSSPGVMFMNYMDYTDDGCMNMFTQGQSTRSNALFAAGGARASILTSNGCTAPAVVNPNATTSSTGSRIGEEQMPAMSSVSLFPNPSQGNVVLGFVSGIDGSVSVRITDMVGKTVLIRKLDYQVGRNQFSFDLSEYSKGIYFVELTNDSQRIIQRLMLDK